MSTITFTESHPPPVPHLDQITYAETVDCYLALQFTQLVYIKLTVGAEVKCEVYLYIHSQELFTPYSLTN